MGLDSNSGSDDGSNKGEHKDRNKETSGSRQGQGPGQGQGPASGLGLGLALDPVRSVRVTTIASLTRALLNPEVFFIECVGLPSHVDNVALHKHLGLALVSAIDDSLVSDVEGRLRWTLHAQGQGPVRGLGQRLVSGQAPGLGLVPGQGLGLARGSEHGHGNASGLGLGLGQGPLVVLLHGWMGDETDYNPLIEQLQQSQEPQKRGFEGVAPYDILTVAR